MVSNESPKQSQYITGSLHKQVTQCITVRKYCPKGDHYIQVPLSYEKMTISLQRTNMYALLEKFKCDCTLGCNGINDHINIKGNLIYKALLNDFILHMLLDYQTS